MIQAQGLFDNYEITKLEFCTFLPCNNKQKCVLIILETSIRFLRLKLILNQSKFDFSIFVKSHKSDIVTVL